MSRDSHKKHIDNTFIYSLINKYSFVIMFRMRYTKKQFEAEYPDDNACLESVFQNRFGDLGCCPKCGVIGATFHRVRKRQCYACAHCGHQLFPLAGTIFRKTTTSLKDWFYAIYLFSVSKNGVSAKELERHLGVTYKTAWRMAKQIRVLMATDVGLLTGEVEVDETYIGGKHRHHLRYSKKQTVFGAVERDGMVRASHVKSSGARVLLPEIRQSIDPSTRIYSDEWGAYKRLPKLGYSHATINHSRLEYVRGEVHTNTIEGFWGQLKRSLDGTYHAVSAKYLQLYLNEFAFRYNLRGVAVCPLLLERAARLSVSVV